jgi:hypothetical protein
MTTPRSDVFRTMAQHPAGVPLLGVRHMCPAEGCEGRGCEACHWSGSLSTDELDRYVNRLWQESNAGLPAARRIQAEPI